MNDLDKSPVERQAQNDLMSYMRGWKKGANGAAVENAAFDNPHFKLGHDHGRQAKSEAYKAASATYGVTLSPLRSEQSSYDTDLAHFQALARKPRNAGWTSLKRRADAEGVPVECYRYHNEGDRLQLALALANKIHGRA